MPDFLEEMSNPPIKQRFYIPTGCSLLNLAMSDDVNKGYEAGTVINLVGGTHTGKSLLGGTCMAEMAYNPAYDDYLMIYDDTEKGFRFDVKSVFGEKTADRLQVNNSNTVLDAHLSLNKLIKEGKPFVYILDSLDGLVAPETFERVEENLAKYEKGNDLSGSYGMEKQRYLATQFFPTITATVDETKSLIIILSQQGKDVGGYQQRNRAGGKALKYYNSLTFWIDKIETLTKVINKQKVAVGNKIKVDITKNRITGKPRSFDMFILHSYGIDDIQTSLNWLMEFGYWDAVCEKLGKTCKQIGPMISYVEENNKEEELKQFLQEAWNKTEDALAPGRKTRYE